jgi:hypothetical protein
LSVKSRLPNVALVIFAFFALDPAVYAANEDAVRKATSTLMNVRQTLKVLGKRVAKADKEEALKRVEESIEELKKALAFRGIKTIPSEAAEVEGKTPLAKLRACLEVMRAAQKDLEEGKPGWGGHRAKAVVSLKQGISSIESAEKRMAGRGKGK